MSIKILALDIETAPGVAFFWNPKQQWINPNQVISYGYTMCWAARWLDGTYTKFKSIYHHGRERMVRVMHDLLNEADAILTYNGVRFDVKKLNAEFIGLGLPPPTPYKHIDLFRTVRSQLALDHSGLDPVAKFLNLGEKIQHKGMELWKGCMNDCNTSWNTMRRYNKHDVQLLIECYFELLPWIKGHPNVALYEMDYDEKKRCTHCGSTHVKKNGVERTQVLVYQRYRCSDCGANMRGRYAIDGIANPNILRST